MRKFWVFYGVLPFLLLTVLFASGFAGHTAAAPGQLVPAKLVQFDIPSDAPDPNETLRLVNAERAAHGLETLRAHEQLGEVAKARAADMASRHYYAHKNPDGQYYYDLFDQYGIETGYNCENLDLVFVPSEEQVISEWMASLKGHRECMMHTKTTYAGYATTKLTLIDFEGKETTAYLVVAIHAEQK